MCHHTLGTLWVDLANLMYAHSNCLFCMRFVWINVVGLLRLASHGIDLSPQMSWMFLDLMSVLTVWSVHFSRGTIVLLTHMVQTRHIPTWYTRTPPLPWIEWPPLTFLKGSKETPSTLCLQWAALSVWGYGGDSQQVSILKFGNLNYMSHSMSNQHKKYLTLSDLDETWFLHSACWDIHP